ncbi:MFS transporter [Shewanella salipaludis]|uniref:MFS transporter n=1 Tax=Shewanella salipaludis TaxID=2723052 RepID=A0A972FRZ2_9GAMM|nr:MFS transporter [Shewanella salipaludis]NMH65103.1 MFS transporter [Shewanella salipaludis]
MNKNLILLWQGQLVSQLGMQAYSIAMMFWLMENTGSSVLMGFILTLSILPNIFFGPIAGVIADRFSRKNIIIVTDLTRGVAVLILSIMIFCEFGSQFFIVMLFATVSVINGISRAFFQPAIDAFIPDLVATEQLSKTVAFFQSSTQCSAIVGQAMGGLLYRALGAPILLFIDAISYFISAFSESFIKSDFKKRKSISGITNKYKQHKVDLAEGLRYVKSCKGMYQTMFFASSINFFIAPIMLLLPFYVTEQLLEEAQWYGFLLAAMAIGSVLGYWISATINVQGNRKTIVMFVSMILFSCSLMLLSQSVSSKIALFSLFMSGLSLGVFNLQATTLFQNNTPTELRGRVMSLLMTISGGLLPLGLMVGGGLGAVTHNNTQFIFGFCALGIAIITILSSLNSKMRSYILNPASEWLRPQPFS